MNRVLYNIMNDTQKPKSWSYKNYFYATTLFFIALNIIIFAVYGLNLGNGIEVDTQTWRSFLNFNCFLSAVANNLSHFDWEHVLLNMLCFFFISLYFERKYGTIKYFLIVVCLILVSAAFISGNFQDLGYAGFSGVNFALHGYFIVDFCFSFNKYEKTKGNLIFNIVILALVILFVFWGIWETDKVSTLFYNIGHYSGFLSGLIISLVANITKFSTRKRYLNENQDTQK